MRIVIAPDSFKECATAAQASAAIAGGVRRVLPDAELVIVPMADGGEGTVDALVASTQGRYVECRVTGPLGEPVAARYGILGGGTSAVIEMAAASGLGLVPPNRRDPRVTTTRGTGELMRDALDRGMCRIIIGIGGSATNDGGAGMAQALGYSLQDAAGRELPAGGAALAGLSRIDSAGRHPGLAGCDVLVACDVTNPLCGLNGASHVYGPQKGADAGTVETLDKALHHYGRVLEESFGTPVLNLPGAGAAGGLGAGLAAFARGRLCAGVDIVAEACALEQRLAGAGLVITGEGAMDGQTVNGKTPVGVAALAKKRGIPVVAIAGSLGPGYEAVYGHGIDAAFSITPRPMRLEEAMEQVEPLLRDTAEAVMRAWTLGRLDARRT